MVQRAVIAMSLSCEPSILIADEPGTALDVVVRARILDLLKSLQAEERLTTLIVSHDLATISYLTDECAVMYAGRVVEQGPTETVFRTPAHPYTQALIESYPKLTDKPRDLESIPGDPPDLSQVPSGCPFHPRCTYAVEECHKEVPVLSRASRQHLARCIFVPERFP
jgi:oligopeptide transport system ATP-binding protein